MVSCIAWHQKVTVVITDLIVVLGHRTKKAIVDQQMHFLCYASPAVYSCGFPFESSSLLHIILVIMALRLPYVRQPASWLLETRSLTSNKYVSWSANRSIHTSALSISFPTMIDRASESDEVIWRAKEQRGIPEVRMILHKGAMSGASIITSLNSSFRYRLSG